MALKLSARVPSVLTPPAPVVPVSPYGLTFNDIKNTIGAYQASNGDTLIVHGTDGAFVEDEATKFGFTRTNMVLLDASNNNAMRRVACGTGPDGEKRWRKLPAGSVTITL